MKGRTTHVHKMITVTGKAKSLYLPVTDFNLIKNNMKNNNTNIPIILKVPNYTTISLSLPIIITIPQIIGFIIVANIRTIFYNAEPLSNRCF